MIPHKLILSGLPGSGKDTQAARLSARLGIPSFSMGDVLREEIARGTETGRLVAPYVERGGIVPAGVAHGLMRERLGEPSVQSAGYVCNGFPRTIETFRQYLDWETPTAVIVLDIPRDIARNRLLARGRGDDSDAVIEARFRAYDEINLPLYDWLVMTDIRVIHVDGTKAVDEISNEILRGIAET